MFSLDLRVGLNVYQLNLRLLKGRFSTHLRYSLALIPFINCICKSDSFIFLYRCTLWPIDLRSLDFDSVILCMNRTVFCGRVLPFGLELWPEFDRINQMVFCRPTVCPIAQRLPSLITKIGQFSTDLRYGSATCELGYVNRMVFRRPTA